MLCDQIWSLVLGVDISMECISTFRTEITTERVRTLTELSQEAFLRLMHVTCTGNRKLERRSAHDADSCLELHHILEQWRRDLPAELEWTSRNVSQAPAAFFMLHQQYHSSMLAVHLLFENYDIQASQHKERKGNGHEPGRGTCSSEACTKHALWITRTLQLYRCRFNPQDMFMIGTIHVVSRPNLSSLLTEE